MAATICRKHDCIVNGTDQFRDFKDAIGQKDPITIKLDGYAQRVFSKIEKGVPIHSEWLPMDGKCVWRYEIDGLWSSSNLSALFSVLVVITITVIIGVVLIAVVVFVILVLKRRNASRQQLGEGLVTPPAQV